MRAHRASDPSAGPLLAILWLIVCVGCSGGSQPDADPNLITLREELRPLHEKLGPPQPGDWLTSHEESGQTFEEYLAEDPVTPTEERRSIVVLPLGDFTPEQRQIVEQSAEFLQAYFGVPTRITEDVPLSVIPDHARRVHPTWGVKQILSTYVLDEVLAPRVPTDACAMIAFTASDLWPGRNWNFVFGQASLRGRVGVWSIHRNGDPAESDEAYRLCLLRTLKTATHETGHMFSLRHCTAYECNLCGSNNRSESDRRPLALCPECVTKVWWATDVDPVQRFRNLDALCTKYGLDEEAAFYRKSRERIEAVEPNNN